MSAKSPSFSVDVASMSVAEVGDWRDGAAGAIFFFSLSSFLTCSLAPWVWKRGRGGAFKIA